MKRLLRIVAAPLWFCAVYRLRCHTCGSPIDQGHSRDCPHHAHEQEIIANIRAQR